MKVSVSDAEMFSREHESAAFELLLNHIMIHGGGMELTGNAEEWEIAYVPEMLDPDSIAVHGRWIGGSQGFESIVTVREKLMLFFILDVHTITLPKSVFISTRTRSRAIGDVIVRNLLFALLRDEKVTIYESHECDLIGEKARLLARHYLYIFRSFFQEDVLNARSGDDALDFVVSNIFYPVDPFSSSLLNSGCRSLCGSMVLPAQSPKGTRALIDELIALRSKLLSFG